MIFLYGIAACVFIMGAAITAIVVVGAAVNIKKTIEEAKLEADRRRSYRS